jgi:ABC-type glycerol-3-phosphate transport system substrate-binding protein
MKKKLLAGIMAGIMALSLAACGSGSSSAPYIFHFQTGRDCSSQQPYS